MGKEIKYRQTTKKIKNTVMKPPSPPLPTRNTCIKTSGTYVTYNENYSKIDSLDDWFCPY